MVLPPVEHTTILLMRFTNRTKMKLIDLVEERLKEEGLITLGRSYGDQTVLRLTTTQDALEQMAESIHLMKYAYDTKTIEYFTIKERYRFCNHELRNYWSGPNGSVVYTNNYHNSSYDDESIVNRDEHGLFTSNEWALLIGRILDNITVLRYNEESSKLSRILDEQYHADYHVHNYDDQQLKDESERTGSNYREHGERSVCLRHVLETYEIVNQVAIAHMPKIRQDIMNKTWWPWYRIIPPIQDIQDYYGWEVSFYFAWMGFLTKWLLFPGILGFLVFLLRLYRHDTIDEDEYTPFYGLITFIWGVLFLRFWQRHEHRLAYQWGTYSLSSYERQKFFDFRPQFRGYLRRSPITGEVETYYPPLRRRLKYVVSALATICMLIVAFSVMILSLNLQGYIHPDTNPKRWNESNPHPFHVRTLAVLSEEGRLFDTKSSFRSILPVILHSACIFTLNKIYSVVAEALTEWENHETGYNHRNSIILKRFLFEAFDCYIALFYLAFYERDVDRLRLELVAVFQIDTFRRILLECIIPMILQRVQQNRTQERRVLRRQMSVRRQQSFNSVIPTKFSLLEDLDKDEYEQFEDYMEIIIQLGYVTLFASAYPMASLISIVANWVEIRSDCFKLTRVCRRPASFRSSGLGMWKTLMACVIWLSALTNCMIAGFTSGQLTYYMPEFYSRDDNNLQYEFDKEDGWLVVFVIFGLERLLILIGLLIYAIVPEVPEDVSDEIERLQVSRMRKMMLAAQKLKKNE